MSREHPWQLRLTHEPRTCTALSLIVGLSTALRANDPDTFKRWLVGGIKDLGKAAVTELIADWMPPLLTHSIVISRFEFSYSTTVLSSTMA